MYAKYTWLATATEAQVRADIIALMCGQTDINSLSASCDKTFSKIITNATPTNWLIHDAAASATSQVLRSLNSDGTTYKYVQVILASGVLTLVAWENWNNTTHVGLNSGTNAGGANSSQENNTITYTVSNSIYIFTTPKYLITSFGLINAGRGTFVFEFSRESTMLDSTYPCHAHYQNGMAHPLGFRNQTISGWGVCRYKNPSVPVGDFCTTSGVKQVITTMGCPVALNPSGSDITTGIYSVSQLDSVIYGIDGSSGYPAYSINLGGWTYSGTAYAPINVVSLGKILGGIYYMPTASFSALMLDEIIYNSITYVLLPAMTPWGQKGWFIVPKA